MILKTTDLRKKPQHDMGILRKIPNRENAGENIDGDGKFSIKMTRQLLADTFECH